MLKKGTVFNSVILSRVTTTQRVDDSNSGLYSFVYHWEGVLTHFEVVEKLDGLKGLHGTTIFF
jgi:hypothetical protein